MCERQKQTLHLFTYPLKSLPKMIIGAICIFLGSAPYAAAQALDGQFTVSQDLYDEIFKGEDQLLPLEIGAEAMRRLIRMVLEDNQLNAQEKDMVYELYLGGELPMATQGSLTFLVHRPDDEARRILSKIATPQDFGAIYDKGGQGYAELYEMSQLAPVIKGKINNFLANGIYPLYSRSSPANQYKPLWDFTANFHAEARAYSAQHHQGICRMMFDAVELLDGRVRGLIPDEAYAGLKHPSSAADIAAQAALGRPISIYIKTLTGASFSVIVKDNDTVMALKKAIQEEDGVPPEKQLLISNGKQMEDMRPLQDYEIKLGASIFLILRAK